MLIREYSSELNAPSQESDSHPRKKKKEKKEDVCVLILDKTDFSSTHLLYNGQTLCKYLNPNLLMRKQINKH